MQLRFNKVSSDRKRWVRLCLAVPVALSSLLPAPAHAAIIPTGDVTPTYNGIDDPWELFQDLIIGDTGVGTLTINNQSVVDSDYVILGNDFGSNGTATVTGAGSTWNIIQLDFGYSDTSSILIQDGGVVNVYYLDTYASNSALTVTGSGSALNIPSTYLIDAGNALNIENTGVVTVMSETTVNRVGVSSANINFNNGTLNTAGLRASFDSLLGTGTINTTTLVSDTDLVFDAVTPLQQQIVLNSLPGQSITLNLDVSDPLNNGALGAGYAGTGTLMIADGLSVSSMFGLLGEVFGSDGTATVTGAGSTWSTSSLMAVGSGGNGTLNIENAGVVNSNSGSISGNPGTTGTVTVTGVGSVWNNDTNLNVGRVGTGTLNIENDGLVNLTGDLSLGLISGTGTVNLSGGTLDLNGGDFTQGGGTANFNFTGGTLKNPALIDLGQPITQTGGTLLFDGSIPTAQINATDYTTTGGLIEVNGPTVVTFDSSLKVNAVLNINNGSVVNNTNGILGHSFATGIATVSGTGSTWNISVDLDVGVGSAGTGILHINNGGVVNNDYGSLGRSLGSTGSATVNGIGSIWDNSNDLYVGRSGGYGTLNIENGGEVRSINGYLHRGTATISGAGSQWNNTGNISMGSYQGDSLNIQDGGVVNSHEGYIGIGVNSTGTATVTGAGSQWNTSGSLLVGERGTGTLSIENGGVVSTDTYGVIGDNTDSTGTATVTGAGSQWDTSGDLIVGDAGTGTLNITNGGKVTSHQGRVGFQTDSNGTVLVSGVGSEWDNQSVSTIVGLSGDGILNIEAGGLVKNQLHGALGVNAESTGTVTVMGAGSIWENGAGIYIADFGSGDMSVIAGGMVTNTVSYIGRFAGSDGTVMVAGTDSKWVMSEDLFVGHLGTGTLNIENGGVVDTDLEGFVGDAALSTGTVTVTGADSRWDVLNSLTIGNLGSGTLNIEDGGVVTNGSSGSVGGGADSISTATVTGAGSQWNSSSNMFVGRFGNGTLNIEDGGVVNTGLAGIIADKTDSAGTVTVTGAESQWNTNSLFVGKNDTGTLNINTGALVDVDLSTTVGSDGSSVINLAGGTLQTGTLELDGDSARLNFTGGTLHMTDQNLRVEAGNGFGSTLPVPAGGSLIVDGTGIHSVGNQGVGEMTVAGSATLTGGLAVGRFTGGDGTLNIQDGGHLSVTGNTELVSVASATAQVNVSTGATADFGTDGLSNSYLQVGVKNTATFNQLGGTVSLHGGALILGSDVGGHGIYNLDSGTLSMNDRSLIIGSGSGSFNFTGGSLSNPGTLNFYMQQAGGTLVRDTPGTTAFTSHYAILNGDVQLSDGAIDVNGALEIAKGLGSSSTFTINSGRLDVGTGGQSDRSLQIGVKGQASLLQWGGTVALHGGDMVLGVDPGPQLASYDGNAGVLEMNGLDIRSGSSLLGTNLLNLVGTTVTMDGGDITTASGSLFVTHDGSMLDMGGGDIKHGAGQLSYSFLNGTIKNAATIDLDQPFVQAGGTLAPGGSIGVTDIIGDYNLTAGTVEIELGGIGNPLDLITVTGDIDITALGTTLDLSALGGMPAGTYTIIQSTGGTLTGMFENVIGLELFGLTPTVQYDATSVAITLLSDLIFSDPNMDGFVGIADLNIVLGNWNQNVTPGDVLSGDLNNDGFVGIGDLNAVLGSWNLGTPPAEAAPGLIPEPATAGVLALGVLCGCARRRASWA